MHIYTVTLDGHLIGLYSACSDAANVMKRLSDKCVMDICHLNAETLLGHDVLHADVIDSDVWASLEKIQGSAAINQEATRRRSVATRGRGAS